ncbi:MAG TPA: hypothetical protein DCX06_13030 [Opitutae bacterium]|nr:hypothetical protein [Opitutae bacterium]
MDLYLRVWCFSICPTPFTACATEMLRGDASVRHVQELLGHSSIDTTQIYNPRRDRRPAEEPQPDRARKSKERESLHSF